MMRLVQVDSFHLVDDGEAKRGIEYAVKPTGLSLASLFGREVNGENQRPEVVAVRLDVDGWHETVLVDEETLEPLQALDRAIAALSAARHHLAAMLEPADTAVAGDQGAQR